MQVVIPRRSTVTDNIIWLMLARISQRRRKQIFGGNQTIRPHPSRWKDSEAFYEA